MSTTTLTSAKPVAAGNWMAALLRTDASVAPLIARLASPCWWC
jgi:hypothetical protein